METAVFSFLCGMKNPVIGKNYIKKAETYVKGIV